MFEEIKVHFIRHGKPDMAFYINGGDEGGEMETTGHCLNKEHLYFMHNITSIGVRICEDTTSLLWFISAPIYFLQYFSRRTPSRKVL